MSALKLVISLWLLVISLFFTTNVLADEKSIKCPLNASGDSADCTLVSCPAGYQPKPVRPTACAGATNCSIYCVSSSNSSPTPTPVPSTPTSAPTPSCPNPTRGCSINSSNYKAPQNANYTILNLEHSISCEIIGASIVGGQNCIAYDEKTPKLYTFLPHGGALGGLNGVMIAMYDRPPTSTYLYVANLFENIGVTPKTAYAQGVTGKGQGVLLPVLQLWQLTRNVAYLSFTLIFVTVGLMIMFRHRINAQTVVTAQMALPGLILGLILVTFSYFIAALIVDLAFVGMKVVASLFVTSGAPGVSGAEQLADKPIWDLFISFISKHAVKPIAAFVSMFTLPPDAAAALGSGLMWRINPILGIAGLIPGVGKPISELIGGGAAQIAGGIIGTLLSLVIIIALVVQMFRLAWKLIQSYIAILVATIMGPLVILLSSIPGRGATLSNWWKGLLANVLVFPAVFGAFLFASVLLESTGAVGSGDPLPLFTGVPAQMLALILGFGVVLMVPAIPDQVKAAFGIKGGGLGAVAGAEAATAVGSLGAGYKQGMQSTGVAAVKKQLTDQQAQTRTGTGAGGWNQTVKNIIQRLPGV